MGNVAMGRPGAVGQWDLGVFFCFTGGSGSGWGVGRADRAVGGVARGRSLFGKYSKILIVFKGV